MQFQAGTAHKWCTASSICCRATCMGCNLWVSISPLEDNKRMIQMACIHCCCILVCLTYCFIFAVHYQVCWRAVAIYIQTKLGYLEVAVSTVQSDICILAAVLGRSDIWSVCIIMNRLRVAKSRQLKQCFYFRLARMEVE